MPIDSQRRTELIDQFARRVTHIGMTAPAILFLESFKPIAFLGAQLLWFSEPFLNLVINPTDLHDFIELIQDEANTEALLARLESSQQPNSSSNAQHRT